jgi:hypothetical protein
MRDASPIYLVLTNVSHAEWSHQIEERRKLIGRSPDADIRIPDRFESVSRRHAEVWTDKYGPWLRDCRSRKGTCVDGVWIDHVPQAGIVVGDIVWFGDVRCEVARGVVAMARAAAVTNDLTETPIPSGPSPPARAKCKEFTLVEVNILLWISRGYHRAADIGRMVYRADGTIHRELDGIFKKLGVCSVTDVMAWLKQSHSVELSLANSGGGILGSRDKGRDPFNRPTR